MANINKRQDNILERIFQQNTGLTALTP